MKASVVVFTWVLISIFISFKQNKHPENQIWSDSQGYYVYLPSVFIYGDFVKEAVRDTGYIRAYKDTDKIYTKYTCGVALMEFPFFMAAHTIAKLTGQVTDGKSPIYGRGLTMAGLFYMWMGLLLLYVLGRRYFGRWPVIFSLSALLLGTNLYYYTFFQPAMSHVYSFFLFAAFLLVTDTLFVRNTAPGDWKLWAVLGLVTGLIVLTRPTNAIICIWPLYVWSQSTADRWLWIRSHLPHIGVLILAAAIPWIPQLLYWKHISGNWVMWSYEGESFKYWKEPKLFRVLFDAWNGWILYSPVVSIPLFFLWKGRYTNRYHERATILILAIATWIFASWWAWWFGGAFGHRSYVEYLALLLIPFAGLSETAFKRPRHRWAVIVFTAVLCYYSLGLTYAYRPPWDGESWTYQSVVTEIKKLFFIAS